MSETLPESSQKKKGLGRGLGSLLSNPSPAVPSSSPQTQQVQLAVEPTTTVQKVKTPESVPAQTLDPKPVASNPTDNINKIWTVSIDRLKAGKYQPRQEFEKEALHELAQSIRQNGILQPIVARRDAQGRLEIVAGERRYRAAQLAGLHEVPVILKEFSDKQTLEMALIENIQRSDLNPIEEAKAYQRLVEEFALTQQQVADKVGKDRATVANALRVLTLPKEVHKLITEKKLSVGHAKVLLSLEYDADKLRWAQDCFRQQWTVRELERQIAKKTNDESLQPSEKESLKKQLVLDLAEKLQKDLGRKVQIDYTNGKGKLSIYFHSDDELNGIAERLQQNV